jgi:hypothetical protein
MVHRENNEVLIICVTVLFQGKFTRSVYMDGVAIFDSFFVSERVLIVHSNKV